MPLGSHGFAAPRAIVLHALRTFMPTHVLERGEAHLATLESTCVFDQLGFGAVNGQDFRTRRDPLGALHIVPDQSAGVETAGREHGSCNHAVGE